MKHFLSTVIFFSLSLVAGHSFTIEASEQLLVAAKTKHLREQFTKIGATQEAKLFASLEGPMLIKENPKYALIDLINGRIKTLSESGVKLAAESKGKHNKKTELVENLSGESGTTICSAFDELESDDNFIKELIKTNAQIIRIYTKARHELLAPSA